LELIQSIKDKGFFQYFLCSPGHNLKSQFDSINKPNQ